MTVKNALWADVNLQVHHWLEQMANQRRHCETGETPAARFQPETLRALPGIRLNPNEFGTLLISDPDRKYGMRSDSDFSPWGDVLSQPASVVCVGGRRHEPAWQAVRVWHKLWQLGKGRVSL
jgi:hypothetical protein